MANTELMNKLMVEKTRLKAATGSLVARAEPVGIVHMTHFSVMALRCEFTTMMAMLAEGKKMEEEVFLRRVISQMAFEIKQLERLLDITVDENGRVHESQTAKLINPGASGLPN